MQRAGTVGQRAIGFDHLSRLLPLAERRRFRSARIVEEDAAFRIDRAERGDAGLIAGHRHGFAFVKLVDEGRCQARRLVAFLQAEQRGGAEAAIGKPLKDRAFGDLPALHLEAVEIDEPFVRQAAPFEKEPHVAGHGDGFVRHLLLVLFVIAAREIVRVLHQPARIGREPEVDAGLKQERREPGHQQRRDRGDQGEEEHQAHMKAGGAAGGAADRQPSAVEHQERHRGNEAANQKERHMLRRKHLPIGRRVGEGEVGAARHDDERGQRGDFEHGEQV